MFNKEFEAMPEKKIRDLQLERLKWSLKHAYSNNSFYKKTFDRAGFNPDRFKSLSDLKNVPFLTKDDMRDNYPFGLFAVPRSEIVRIHTSSGTTGKPTIVGYTKNDIALFAEANARALASFGAGKNDTIQIAYGYGLFTGGLGIHYGSEKLGAMTIPAGSGNMERQIMMMEDLEVTYIACTPSYALSIAGYLEGKKGSNVKRPGSLKGAILGAEPWTENMRKEIESRLRISAYDIYGLSEVLGPGVACECSEKSGLHLYEDLFYAEIIDPDTLEVLREGEKGEIVFTTLTKEGFPSIRYRSKDITRLYRENCRCGRTMVKMEKVAGRTDNMLIIRGVNVFPSQIESVLLGIDGIDPFYQILVDRKGAMDEVEVQVEVDEKIFTDDSYDLNELSARIAEKLKAALGIVIKISLVEAMTIPRSEGKAARVVDRRKII